jgi:hypothetical protein
VLEKHLRSELPRDFPVMDDVRSHPHPGMVVHITRFPKFIDVFIHAGKPGGSKPNVIRERAVAELNFWRFQVCVHNGIAELCVNPLVILSPGELLQEFDGRISSRFPYRSSPALG